jgi:hypothetical protein
MARPRYDITGTVITEHGISIENPSIYVDTKTTHLPSKNELNAEYEAFSSSTAKSEGLALFKLRVQKTRSVPSLNEEGEQILDVNDEPVFEDEIYFQRVANFSGFKVTDEEKLTYSGANYFNFEKRMISEFLNIPLENITISVE